MAINFPDSPINGTTYDYLGVRYIWKDTGGGTGLWTVTTPGTYGAATAAEIDHGIDPVKYVTPLELERSEYVRLAWKANSVYLELGTDDMRFVTSLALTNSTYRKTKIIQPENQVFFYGSGNGAQEVDRIVSLSSSAVGTGAKMVLVRARLLTSDPSFGHDIIRVWPNGEVETQYPFNRFSVDLSIPEGAWSEPFWVKVGTSDSLKIRWGQFATSGVSLNCLSAIY